MNIHGGPVWVITGVKSPSILVKLVREDQIELVPIETRPRVDVGGRVWIDRVGEVGNLRYLPSRVDSSQIVRSIGTELMLGVERDDGVPGEQCEDTQNEEKQTSNVHEPTRSKDGASVGLESALLN